MSSFLSVTSRRLKEVNFAVLQFNYALVSTILTGIILFAISIDTKTIPFNYPDWITYGELFAAGLINFFGQSLHVISNQNANPATVQLFGYVGVAYMFLSDLIFFELALTAAQLIGVLICLTCSVAVVTYKMMNQKPEGILVQKCDVTKVSTSA